jgi:hypothetical protein
LRDELLDTLERCFADNQSSWDLDAGGAWQRRAPGDGEQPRSVQQELAELYAARAASERPAGEPDGGAGDGHAHAGGAGSDAVTAARGAAGASGPSVDW